MNEYWMYVFATFVGGALLALALVGFGLAAAMPGLDRWSRRFFMLFFAMLTLCVGCFLFESLSYGEPDLLSAIRVAGFLDSLLPTALISMSAIYLLHHCGESWHKSTLFRIVFALWTTYFIVVVIAQFIPVFYYYSQDSQLHLGTWYPLPVTLAELLIATILAGVVRRRNQLSRRLFHSFLILLIPMLLAMFVSIFTPDYLLIDIGITISSIAMFAIAILEQIEQYIQLQKETARQRASIMVLKMRPHFIHNTMTSIYYLCDQDPKAAQQVTMDFNIYLRKNLTAISSEDTIPFSDELEHTRAYLAVEQVQFANKLIIEFDTPYKQFRIPPLTLQPLAENAVKHGMGPNTIPLHVVIRTRAIGTGSQIVVEDDGVGFDPTIANDPDTTLSNIRQRLKFMCNGSMEIESREGGGTRVKITIPQT
ncbi:MAG: histidine kinase [Atopobiaceae bacterium]|nr:histidine kinase [Atopobiaceae bacterium]